MPHSLRHSALSAVLLSFTLFSCQTLRPTASSGEAAPEEKPYVSQAASQETIVILGTNDIHGALAPEVFHTKDPNPVTYERGGAVTFGRHLDILEHDYGSRLLWLDAGDEFQGSIDSNLEEGKPMVDLFNLLGLDAAVIGNHEFDFGPPGAGVDSPALRTKETDVRGALKQRIAEAKYPYLAANVFDKKTGKPGLPGTQPSVILNAGRVKVGLIGLTTQETPTSTRPEYVKDLDFKDLAKVTQSEAAKLRSQGADIVVAVAHAGVWCNFAERSGKPISSPLVKSEQTLQSACDPKDEIPQMLRHLPKGTVDAIVSGHTHSLVHHWIDGVPVIQSGTRLQYYNLLYLTYDLEKKAVVTEKTRVEGPIALCPKVFRNQNNCNGDLVAPKEGRGDLVPAKIRGEVVTPETRVEAMLKPYFDRTDTAKKRIVGKVNRKIDHIRTQESPFGNLVADAIRKSVDADVGLVNAGGIRANIEAGDLKYEDIFRALPFDNFVSILTLKGKELMRLLRIAESGARGYFPVSGVRMKVIDLNQEPWSKDLNGDGRIEPWEMDRIVEATLEDGSPISDEKTYKVATIDFLVQGGDSMGWFMNQIPKECIKLVAGPILRDAVIDYIGKFNQPLNTETQPLVNPEKPRIQRVDRPTRKSTSGKSGGGRRHRRRHR